MAELSWKQRAVLEAIIREADKDGPPTAGRVKDLMESRSAQELSALVKKGYLRQPYTLGPYIPMKDLDGTPLHLRLVRGGDSDGQAWQKIHASMNQDEREAMRRDTYADVKGLLHGHVARLQEQEKAVG